MKDRKKKKKDISKIQGQISWGIVTGQLKISQSETRLTCTRKAAWCAAPASNSPESSPPNLEPGSMKRLILLL
jgi:hypothetical protein